ncbi:MAG TPA: hypothetical protein VK656_05920 [Candidatus Acidoferrum sp.]|nr:hypothetical protein [Candidatus Acidoferrum sp.]
MDGLVALFSGLIGLLVLALAALGYGADTRSYARPSFMEAE